MNPDNGENVRIPLCQLNRTPAALNRSADGNDAGNTSVSRATKYIVKVIGEVRVIEVSVCFDQHVVIPAPSAKSRNL